LATGHWRCCNYQLPITNHLAKEKMMFIRKSLLIAAVLLGSLFLAACGGDNGAGQPPAAAAGDPVQGERLYQQSCAACHAMDGTGVPGLGKDLTTSAFTQSLSDQELVAFTKEGRPSGHPDNTTGIDMPPKGGNPALTDAQILDIVAYMRTIER
jgi:mono/diheme cytochrome c family protein